MDDVFSICVPTYGRVEFLRECLESCLVQSWPNIEIIVQDDCHDDRVRDIVKSYGSPDIRYVRHPSPVGLTAKLNSFLQLATGTWGAVLCDDDRLAPMFVRRVMDAARRHPEASLIRPRAILMNAAGAEFAREPGPEVSQTAPQFFRTMFDPGVTENLSGRAVPLARLRAIGGFPETYRSLHMDRIVWARLAAGGPVVTLSECLVAIRCHDNSLSASTESDFFEARSAIENLRSEVAGLIAAEESRPAGEDDLADLRAARGSLDAFCRHSTVCVYRKAFAAALRANHPAARGSIHRLVEARPLLGGEEFRLMPLFRFLSHMPQPLRVRALDTVSRYRSAQRFTHRPAAAAEPRLS